MKLKSGHLELCFSVGKVSILGTYTTTSDKSFNRKVQVCSFDSGVDTVIWLISYL